MNDQSKRIDTDQINLKKLNFLNFKKIDKNKFPSIKIIKRLKNKETLLETIIVIANDELVNLFLLKKINFTDITFFLQKLISMNEIINLSKKKTAGVNSILSLKS
jgi:1-deoxy-D-xylulose-5-phosphate reductoisomerase